MATFKSEFIDTKTNILIPALQRDYVQGGRNDIINSFLDKLVLALLGKEKLDLNYIYGSFEIEKAEKYFVPIDGQQRLITLWLFHLYLFNLIKQPFNVRLQFMSREFANSFTEKLMEKIQSYTNSKTLKTDIVNSSWFVNGWLYDTTVCNMLNTLDLIAKKIYKVNKYDFFENITFSFLDMKTKGLTDDVYIKMNGRGRPLTYFENLKSWMDGKIIDIFGHDNEFTQSWQRKIDNEWTDFFWENRNKKQEHHEEIDDEQQRFFYSILLTYWIKNVEKLILNIKHLTKEDTIQLCLFLNLSEDTSNIAIITNKLYELFREGKKLVPLYWLEKINLFEEKEIFIFIMKAIDKLCEVNHLLNNNTNQNKVSSKYLDLDTKKDRTTTLMYKVAMENASYAKTLPYLYAIVKTPTLFDTEKDFFRWMRLIRNLVINSSIDRQNLSRVYNCIDILSESIKSSENFYIALSNCNVTNVEGFNTDQLAEEVIKAEKIATDNSKDWEGIFVSAEGEAFFNGSIRFLFRNEEGKLNDWSGFETKWSNSKLYFDKDGVKDSNLKYKSEAILLKALISRCDDFWAQMWWSKCIFNNESANWRNILLSKKWIKAVNDILDGNVTVIENSFSPINDWCNDKGLFKYIVENRKNAWIRSISYDRFFSFWESRYPAYMIPTIPNLIELKKQGIITYRKECKIPNSNFATCNRVTDYGIDFIYQNSNFRYFMYPSKKVADVYLLDKNWNYIETGIESSDDHKSYYCFDVKKSIEKDSNKFIDELENLIKRK